VAEREVRELRIPLPGGEDIQVTGRFPVTQANWAFFLSVLEAMRPGLVSDDLPNFMVPGPEGEQR
jgi:hypothetical protein